MERSSFFNSVNHDRKYNANDFTNYLAPFFTDGIFINKSNALQVVTNDDMSVTVKSGLGFVKGKMYENTDNLILQIDNADGILKRIDNIVLQLDYLGRVIKAKVVKGAFSANPTAPELTRNTDYYELLLASVFVLNGATKVAQSNITDTRLDDTVCGIVYNPLDHIDTTTLYEQIQSDLKEFKNVSEADFSVWFESVKGQLSEDVAGHLQTQINEIKPVAEKNTNDINQLSNPNLLINGDFKVWQRGLSITPSKINTYICDRWKIRSGVNKFKYQRITEGIKITNLSSMSSSIFIEQMFEYDLNLLKSIKNNSVTISFEISGAKESYDYSCNFQQYDTGGRLISSTANITGTCISNKRGFFVSGNDIDTNYTIGLMFSIKNLDPGANVVVKYIKMEIGTNVTRFVPKTYAEELETCKRYYVMFKNNESDNILIGNGLLAKTIKMFYCTINLPTSMRAMPTVSGIVTDAVIWSSTNEYLSATSVIRLYFCGNIIGVRMKTNNTDTALVGNLAQLWIAPNKAIEFDAEIY